MAKKNMLLFGLLLTIFSLNVIQSKLYESESDELSEAASNVQENLVSLDDLDYSNIKNNIIKRDVPGVDEQEESSGKSMRARSGQRRYLPSGPSRAERLLQPRAQRRSERRGRFGSRGRRLQRGRRGRSPGRRFPSRGRLDSRGRRGSRGRSKGRLNQSPSGETVLEEEAAEEDVAEEELVPYPYYYDYYDYYYC